MFQMSAATAAVQAVEGQTIGLLDRDRRLSLQMDKLEVGLEMLNPVFLIGHPVPNFERPVAGKL